MPKSSKSYIAINLENLLLNYNFFLSKLSPQSKFGACVKANAYGLGMIPVSTKLYEAGVKHLNVGYLKEAIELYGTLSDATIFIFDSLSFKELEIAARHGFIPTLNSLREIKDFNEIAKKLDKKLPCQIQFETGMGRSGLQQSEVIHLATHINEYGGLDIKYLMSHLACAFVPSHILNQQQLTALKAISQLLPNIPLNLANSAGVLLGEQYHLDMVRVGCGLYGINPLGTDTPKLNQVLELYGGILDVRTLEKDQSISYGGTYQAKKGQKIITVEVGYADGYKRALSGKAHAFHQGYKMPLIGMVSMDMIMLDASMVPEQILNSMTQVELIGPNITADELAVMAGTISYEILTSIGNHRLDKVLA